MPVLRKELCVLGYAGLIPFIGLALIAVFFTQHTSWAQQWLGVYALGIILFLLGSWWGLALMRRNRFTSIASNMLFLIALAAYVGWPQVWLIMAALMLGVIVMLEQGGDLFRRQPKYYRQMRLVLTVVGAVCLLLAY